MKIFWAWQSDLPGKVSRFFVRDALLAAIEKLKEAPDIEEPSEEARRNDMHLDSDRQGLSGSPDLARAILEKIDASSVFVGDVTPVGKGSATKADDGTLREAKPLMNANLAIELGYAIERLTDAGVWMVLNTAYGDRDGLPFDIKHKAGPIMYRLAEGASGKDIAAEKARLVPRLAEALAAFKPIDVLATISDSLSDLRVADSPRVSRLFESDERDKLFPLLEAEKLTAWARPRKGNDPLGRLPGNIWKSHFLLSMPKEGQWDRAQTFIKTKAGQETMWFDLHLNQRQVELIWPELELLPILKAAGIAFEAAEEVGIEELVSSHSQSAAQKLSHLVSSILVHDYPLRGKKPPSTISRLIPKDELSRLHHVIGTNSIRSDFASTPLQYDDVTIIRADLNDYIGSLRRVAKASI